jgi:NADH-quinone oxidoreductase subunit N
MTVAALVALLPVMVVTGASVLVMLAIAWRRDAGWAFRLTLVGLILALAVLPVSARLAPMPVTGLMRIDAYAVFFFALIAGAAAFVALLCHGYFRCREREEIYVLLLTATLGGMLMVASNHFALFFLGLEILSVSLFPLIAFRVGDKTSLEAGMKYLMLSGVSSAFLLFGMALIYGAFGVLSFPQLGGVVNWLDDPLALIGAILVLAGLGFKLSLVPFHLWTPDVYQGAPAPVTAFIATVSKTAVFALLVRLWITGGAYRGEVPLEILGFIGALSVLAGNALALLQTNLKRMLAYSSIAHMGYALIAFVAGSALQTELLVESVGFYLFAYVLTSLGALGVVSALSQDESESETLEAYAGLCWREPWMAVVLTVSLLSLAGIPLTVGFIGKFYVFAAAIHASHWLLVASVVVGSGIGLYYYLRVVLVMVGPIRETSTATCAQPFIRPTLFALIVLLVWAGVFPEPMMRIFRAVAEALA